MGDAEGGLPRAFSIGLSPHAQPERWLQPDDRLEFSLAEKDRLIAGLPGDVFMAIEGTEAAQEEVADLLRGHLVRAFPDVYATEGDAVTVAGHRVDFADRGEPSLQKAARLVADDLVIMRRQADGWNLVAASLCFPTKWVLADKIGRPITAIHEPVPGFAEGTRNAAMVERILDHLQPGQTVKRSNWSVHKSGDLRLSEPYRPPLDLTQLGRAFLRREFQTLTRLPASGDILFTIRVHADPLGGLEAEPDRRSALAERLMQLEGAELAYKGMTRDRDRLVAWLLEKSPD